MNKILFALLASAAIAISGCGDDAATKSSAPGPVQSTVDNSELNIGLTQEFENLNPMIAQMLATTYLQKVSGRSLVVMDADAQWQPQIVEKIPSIENGDAIFFEEDGVEKIRAVWRIKDDQFWGDGTPVTAKDVEFSWQVGGHKNVTVGEKEVYTKVERFEIDPQDSKKFTLIYRERKWDFARMGTFYILPEHLEGPVFRDHSSTPLGYEKNTLFVTDATNPGLYNGPYRVSEIKLGSHLVFVHNEYWRGKTPDIKRLVFKIIPNTATLEANIRSGTIDMISLIGLKFDQALKFQQTIEKEKLPLKINYKESVTYEHIDLQLKNPLLQDVRVRKALVYAINRDELVNALFEGKQKKAIHNTSPVDPWYTDDPKKIVTYPYSTRKANKLLNEAGWILGEDNYRYKDGKKLSFQFMTTSGDKSRELVQTYLQDQWKNVGIEITIKNEPARVYFGETIRKSKFPGLAMFAWISSPENSPAATLHSKNIPTTDNNYSGQNDPSWSNAEVDRLIDELDLEFDAEKRKDLVASVLYQYTNDVPVIPLYYRAEVSVTPTNLTGYHLTGHQFLATNHIEYWSLR